jgi:hypothetical protein
LEEIRNILVDLNGCIVGPPSRELFEGLHELSCLAELTKGENPPFLMGACSGREMPYVRGVLHIIGSPNGWSIYESGLGIFHILNEDWRPNPRLTYAIRHGFTREIIGIAVPQILSRHKGMIRLYKGNELNVALEMTPEATFSIEDFYAEVQEELKDFLEAGLVITHHSTDAVDISPVGIDKGTGTLQIAEVTDIPLAQTLGIGDSNGDRPMLELVRFAGCPQNASEECKELVRSKGKRGYISPYPYAKGVANIIKRFTGAGMR